MQERSRRCWGGSCSSWPEPVGPGSFSVQSRCLGLSRQTPWGSLNFACWASLSFPLPLPNHSEIKRISTAGLNWR